MLLQSILDQLDDELARLCSLRAIIAGLETPLQTEPAIAPETAVRPSFARALRNPAESRGVGESAAAEQIAADPPSPEPEALKRVRRAPVVVIQPARQLPMGPIVVSAAELEKERARRGVRTGPEPAPMSAALSARELNSESAARLLATRWLNGGRQDGASGNA